MGIRGGAGGEGGNNVPVIRRERQNTCCDRVAGRTADAFAEIPIFVTAHGDIHYTARTGIILI